MKCTQCGSTELFKSVLEVVGFEALCRSENFIPYVCEKCGHVEFYAKETYVKSVLEKRAEAFAKEEFEKEKKKKIDIILAEIENLKVIIDDENRTVKEVKCAKEQMNEKYKELEKVRNSYYVSKIKTGYIGW